MSKAAYIGVGDKARKIKAIYVGDSSGKARRVTAGYVGVGGVARQFFATGPVIGDLEAGSIVRLNVSGKATEFIVAHQGLPSDQYDASCDGTWLVMKDIHAKDVWGNVNLYEGSTISIAMEQVFYGKLDKGVQSIVMQADVPWKDTTVRRHVFPLTAAEVGLTGSDIYRTGAKLDYFLSDVSTPAVERRVANYNGKVSGWFTRDAVTTDSASVCEIGTIGRIQILQAIEQSGYRPAMILPRETRVSEDGTIIV